MPCSSAISGSRSSAICAVRTFNGSFPFGRTRKLGVFETSIARMASTVSAQMFVTGRGIQRANRLSFQPPRGE